MYYYQRHRERNEHKTYDVYGLTVQSITESPTENPELSVKTDFFNLTPIPYNADLLLGGNFANAAHLRTVVMREGKAIAQSQGEIFSESRVEETL